MREIKFRAKVKWNGNHYEAGQWVYGYYAYFDGKHQIYDCGENYVSGIGDFTRYAWVEIDETSLSEYTGLKDKNGVEIYEGDVVKLYNRALFVIDFGEWQNNGQYETFKDGYGWYMRHISGWDDGNESLSSDMDGEVIGNIYDNPELLDAK